MFMEVTKVLILGANELFPEQLPRVLPFTSFLCENAIAEERSKDRSASPKSVVCEVRRQDHLDIAGVQYMICSWAEQEVLTPVVPWLIVLCDGSKEGKKPAICIGLPKFLNAVDAEGPSLWQFWGKLAAMLTAKLGLNLAYVRHLTEY